MTLFLVNSASDNSADSAAAGDHRFVGSLLALVVEPGDHHLLAGPATLESEMQEGIARHRGSPLRRQHGLAAMGDADVPDEMRRNGIAARVSAKAGLHLVVH